MDINEFKRELSKVSGIDFFNPKYRELFKKYFPADKDAEEERLKDMGGADEEEITEKEEDIDKAEDEREIDKIEEEKADTPEKRDEEAEEKREETHEIGKEVDAEAESGKKLLIEYMEYLEYLAKWNGKLPDVMMDGNSGTVMIPLPSDPTT